MAAHSTVNRAAGPSPYLSRPAPLLDQPLGVLGTTNSASPERSETAMGRMVTLASAGYARVLEGDTTVEEVRQKIVD